MEYAQTAHDDLIHQEELPEREGLLIDFRSFRYEQRAFCLSAFCSPNETCPIQGKEKFPNGRNTFCPDCGHALVWRVRKERKASQ